MSYVIEILKITDLLFERVNIQNECYTYSPTEHCATIKRTARREPNEFNKLKEIKNKNLI